jgi:hypothetical protein
MQRLHCLFNDLCFPLGCYADPFIHHLLDKLLMINSGHLTTLTHLHTILTLTWYRHKEIELLLLTHLFDSWTYMVSKAPTSIGSTPRSPSVEVERQIPTISFCS